MSALTATDVWAVGDYIEAETPTQVINSLIVHWDGSTWMQVPSPNPSSTNNYLSDVSAQSATDAWAVGWYTDKATQTSSTLILHWDGSTWTQVPSPTPAALDGILLGVSARSTQDAWAVGVSYPTGGGQESLILHWDGSSWSRLRGPDVDGLHRVSAASAADAWAVGVRSRWFLRWNGDRWSKVLSHSPRTKYVWGVTTQSGTDAWAVGSYLNDAGNFDTVVLHWDGTRWSRIGTPTAGRTFLMGVSSTRASNAWAVGDIGRVRQLKTLIYHWDGRSWSRVETPNPSSTSNDLWDVDARSATDAWAVGSFYDESTGVGNVLILHWDGTRWSL